MRIVLNKKYLFQNKEVTVGSEGKIVSIEDLNFFRTIAGKEKIKTIAGFYEKMLLFLNCGEKDLKPGFFSNKNKIDYLTYLKQKINETQEYVTDYDSIHAEKMSLFEKIVHIDKENTSIYDDFTKTGRMRITKGKNFLTMKKTERKNLYKNTTDVMFELDFKSCEPSFYLFSENIIEKCEDVYEELMNEIDQKIKRDKFKLGFLALLYGGNAQLVKKISGINLESYKKMKKVTRIDQFSEKLSLQSKNRNFITNFYGRPIFGEKNLVNYYVQSSAADFYCLAFNQFLSKNKYIKLHACIHDAIVCTIKKEDVEKLREIKSIKELHSNVEIPVNIEFY